MKGFKKVVSFILAVLMVVTTFKTDVYAGLSVPGLPGPFFPEPEFFLEVKVKSFAGYEEGAYITWEPLATADGYRVLVKDAESSVSVNQFSDYTEIDDELIRYYEDDDNKYYRADILGLKAGLIADVKVEAVTLNEDKTVKSVIGYNKKTVTVDAYDRSGFAFINADGSLYNGGSVGAYNADGSLKEGTDIIYVTDYNKDSVSINLLDSKGEEKTYVGIQNIFNAYKVKKDGALVNNNPLCVRLIGNITDPYDLTQGDLSYENQWNASAATTIEGVGNDAVLNGSGLIVTQSNDVEVRNIAIMNCASHEGDSFAVNSSNHIWLHNNETYYGLPGVEADQKKGDGSMDCKWSDFVTFSYNHFVDSGKCNLLSVGPKSEYGKKITYHHNWYDHTDSRNPRVRYYTAHVYNNYFDGIGGYSIGACQGSSVFSENNYFRHVKAAYYISMQGTENGKSLSNEPGGMIKAYGDKLDNVVSTPIAYNATTAPESFDYYKASSRDELVPETVVANKGKTESDYPAKVLVDYGYADESMRHYNNFDTDEKMYSYSVDATEDVKDIVTAKAGRIEKGDFQYNGFTIEDDSLTNVKPELSELLKSYEGKVISVGGINVINAKAEDGPHGGKIIPETGAAHDFIVDRKFNEYFEIQGKYNSSTRTEASYNGKVKHENVRNCFSLIAAASISFETEVPMKLVVIGANRDSEVIQLDDRLIYSVDHIYTVGMPAGKHVIKPVPERSHCDLFEILVLPITEDIDITIDNDNGTEKTIVTVPIDKKKLYKKQVKTPSKDGYTFVNWTDESGAVINFPYDVYENQTIKASYIPNEVPKAVAMNLDIQNMTEVAGNLQRNGFVFNNKTYAMKTNNPVTKDGIKYEKSVSTEGKDREISFETEGPFNLTVIVRTNGSSGEVRSLELKKEDSSLVATFSDSAEGTSYTQYVSEAGKYTLKSTASIRIYELDIKPVDGNTITFNAMGGACEVETFVLKSDEVTKEPATPVREGYYFKGWFADYDCTIPFTFGKTISGPTFVFARWKDTEDIPLNITFDANGGTVSTTTKGVISGDPYGELPVPEKTGYDFVGWFTDKTAGEEIKAADEVEFITDATVYAHWTAKTYKVTFDANEGEVSTAEKNVTYDGVYGDLPVATRNKYTFAGWFTDKETGEEVKADDQVIITSDITLYAHWTKNIPEAAELDIEIVGEYAYTANAIIPEIAVTFGGEKLHEGIDYTVACKNNINAYEKEQYLEDGETINKEFNASKAPTVTVTGKGKFTGKAVKYFTIDRCDIGVVIPDNYVLNAKNIAKINPVFTYNNKKLTNEKDYVIKVPIGVNPTEVDSYVATVLTFSESNFKGSKEFTVKKVSVENKISGTVNIPNLYYTGKDMRETVKLFIYQECDSKKIKVGSGANAKVLEKEDIVVTMPDEIKNIGTYSVSIFPKNTVQGATGVITKKVVVSKAPFSKVINNYPERTYSLKYGIEGINFEEADKEGNASVKYSPAGATANIDTSNIVTYYQLFKDGKGEEKQPVNLTGDFVEGRDFTVAYSNNKKVGKATVKLTGKGNFTGVIGTLQYNIEKADISDAKVVIPALTTYVKKGVNYKPQKMFVELDGYTVKSSEYTVKYYLDNPETEGKNARELGKKDSSNKPYEFEIDEDKMCGVLYAQITAKDLNYKGSIVKEYYVYRKADIKTNLSTATVKAYYVDEDGNPKTDSRTKKPLEAKTLQYTGSEITTDTLESSKEPVKLFVTVKVTKQEGSKKITGTVDISDYVDIELTNNVNIGNVTMVVTKKGDAPSSAVLKDTATGKEFDVDLDSVNGFKSQTIKISAYNVAVAK